MTGSTADRADQTVPQTPTGTGGGLAWRARPGGLSSPIPPTLSKAATGECHREGVRASCAS
ncbi:MAG TPA: hypothetical protein VGI68_06000 [Mycobacterium sp.]